MTLVTHGNLMLINTRHAKKDTTTQKNPKDINMILLNLVRPVRLLRSSIMNPKPPRTNRKLDTKPSMMYCPLTRYWRGKYGGNHNAAVVNMSLMSWLTCMNATGLEWPNSSVVEPMEGGSTITS